MRNSIFVRGRRWGLLAGLWTLLLFYHCEASEIHVSSIIALQAAINGASAGDVIVLENGTYLNNTLSITTNNITVKAGTPGGVSLNGMNAITITGHYVTFSGFQFTSGSIDGIVVVVSGDHVVLTQLNFKGYSAQKYINLQGQYDEVSFCNFEGKPSTAPQGNLIHIAPNGLVPNYARIRYCSFRNMPGAGGDNGNECIRIANGAQSTYVCRAVVEYCYFENTGMGDSEAISVKSRENALRYNTFQNNQNAMMVFRNGDNNVAYGNFFINAGGIRVKEANNVYCYNNYFENSGIGGNADAVTYVYYTANTLNVLQNINFLHNTFVDCGDIDLDKGATNNTWSNNIFKKSTGTVFVAGSAAGIAWTGNIYSGTLGLSIPAGMTNADPKLTKDTDGYYVVSSTSPAINAASASHPSVLDIEGIDDDPLVSLDISGRSRPASATLKDVGCTEYNAVGTVTNKPLKLSDVGPSYLGGPVTSVTELSDNRLNGVSPTEFRLDEPFPNPFNPSTALRFQIPWTTHVSMKIFDQLGREIETLINGVRQAGRHQVRWNASQCRSGVYFCRLYAHQRMETTKLLLLK
jgi:hypothetical protein